MYTHCCKGKLLWVSFFTVNCCRLLSLYCHYCELLSFTVAITVGAVDYSRLLRPLLSVLSITVIYCPCTVGAVNYCRY